MRPILATIAAVSIAAVGGISGPTAAAEASPLKRCGTVVVRLPHAKRISGSLSTRGLTCRTAKITVRNIARRYAQQPTSFKVRGNTFDCEGYGGDLSCAGIRPGDEDPSIGFTFRAKRR